MTQAELTEVQSLQSHRMLSVDVLRLTPSGSQVLLAAEDRENLDIILLDLDGVTLPEAVRWVEGRWTTFSGEDEGLEPSVIAVGGPTPTSEEIAAAAEAGVAYHDSTTEALGPLLAKMLGQMQAVAVSMQSGSPLTTGTRPPAAGAADIPHDVAVYAAAPYRLSDADFEALVRRTQAGSPDRED